MKMATITIEYEVCVSKVIGDKEYSIANSTLLSRHEMIGTGQVNSVYLTKEGDNFLHIRNVEASERIMPLEPEQARFMVDKVDENGQFDSGELMESGEFVEADEDEIFLTLPIELIERHKRFAEERQLFFDDWIAECLERAVAPLE
jgi:hypothetical protein